MKKTLIILSSGLILLFSGCSEADSGTNDANKNSNSEIGTIPKTDVDTSITAKTHKSPWHIKNLYSDKTKTWFIPYQLWSGVEYDGNKTSSINHQIMGIKHTSYIKSNGQTRKIEISGTTKILNEADGIEYNAYIKKFYTKGINYKTQYFVSNHMGIGRIYDTRYGFYPVVGIKFPSGYGWELNKLREINTEKRKRGIIITNMVINNKNELESITFKWFRNDVLDHTYTYKVNVGIYDAIEAM